MAVPEQKPITITGHLPGAAIEEFSSTSILDELLPQDFHVLFRSVAAEFGTGAVRHLFLTEQSTLEIRLDDLEAPFFVNGLNPYEKWSAEQSTDSFVIRSVCHGIKADVNDLNKHHPYVKFYEEGDGIVVEGTLYLTYGIPVLNILDQLSMFIKTVKLCSE